MAAISGLDRGAPGSAEKELDGPGQQEVAGRRYRSADHATDPPRGVPRFSSPQEAHHRYPYRDQVSRGQRSPHDKRQGPGWWDSSAPGPRPLQGQQSMRPGQGAPPAEEAQGLRSSPRVQSHVGLPRSGNSFSIWRTRLLTSVLILTGVQCHLQGRARPPGWGLPCCQSRKNMLPRQVQGGLWALGVQGWGPREVGLLTL